MCLHIRSLSLTFIGKGFSENMAGGAKRKRPGGQQQRMKAARLEIAKDTVGSLLVKYLLGRMVWGLMTPQEIRLIASLAKKDLEASSNHPEIQAEIETLASAGCEGAYPNKVYGDIMSRCMPATALPQPFLFRLPFRRPFGELLQSCLLPHELFASIYHNYKSTWAKCIVKSEEVCEHFWKTMEGHPAIVPGMTSRPNFFRRCIPFALHGDGVPLTGVGKSWQHMITDFSFYSLLGEGNTADLLMFLFCMFDKLRQVGRDSRATAHRFFEILRWSFKQIWLGTWPTHDYDNRKPFSYIDVESLVICFGFLSGT